MVDLLPIPDAEIYYDPGFLTPEESSQWLQVLLSKCAWQRHQGPFGHPVPRDEAYYGDSGTNYTYSRRGYQPIPWIPELLSLKSRVEQATPAAAYSNLGLPVLSYNAVLCNLYRDGNDSVGLHADAEREMGPVIGSVSLGAERTFRLKANNGTVVWSQRLPSGSLVVMAGQTQKRFKHEVPKEPHVTDPRINLTFRRVVHPEN